jgi:Tfp pilus assembly protein PilF
VKAKLELKNVLQIDPKDVGARYMLGLVNENLREWQDAFVNYSQGQVGQPVFLEQVRRQGPGGGRDRAGL